MNGFGETHEHDGEASGPDLRLLFVRGLVRSLPWILLVTLLGAAIGFGAGLMQPNRYVSNAKLLLRMGAREQLTSESLVDLGERRHAPPPTMADELQMLSDVAIYERVARELGARIVLGPADPGRGDGPLTPLPVRLLHGLQGHLFRRKAESSLELCDDEVRLATKVLREGTIVVNEPGSSVILVSHTTTSPELARTIVQSLASAFIERHREQFSVRALLESSRSQLVEAGKVRDEAAEAYLAGVSRSGVIELEAQLPRVDAELSALERELFDTRVRREEIDLLRTWLSNRQQGVSTGGEAVPSTVLVTNEEYETQLTLKRMLLAQKHEMLIQERPSKELRRREAEFDEQITEIDRKLELAPRSIVAGPDAQGRLGPAALDARILELELEYEAIPVRLGLLESRLEAKRALWSGLQSQLLTATMLRAELASARDAAESRHASLLQRLSVLEALESIDADQQANLSVLQAPTLEHEKVGPERASLLLKGLLVGLLAAIALAVLRQRFEPRLRHPETFEHARGVPVLGVVPDLSSLRRLEKRAPVARR